MNIRITPYILALVLCLSALAMQAQDHTSRYYVQRAQNYASAGGWNEAKSEIDEGLKSYPDDPDLRYLNGRYYYVTGDFNQARYNLVKATQLNDQHFRAKRVLVDVEDTLHHYSSSICYINELLEFQPYDRDLWRRKIALYRKMGNNVEADASLERLAHIYPNDTIIRRDLRSRNRENWNGVLQKSTLYEQADNLEQWLDIDPDNLSYYLALISKYTQMGERDRALGVANRGLYRFPRNAELVRKAAGLMTEMGLYPQALSFVKSNGGTGALYNNILSETADVARLKDPYEANGRLYASTHNRDALSYLLNTALTRGYYDDARVYLDESYKLDGRTLPLLMKQYSLERRFGNEQAAVRLLQEMYDIAPSDSDIVDQYAEMMMQLAWHDISTGQWAEAYQHMGRALDNMLPEHESWPAAMSQQITILGHLNRRADARQLCREAMSLDPQNSRRYAAAYEDVMAGYLKTLIEEERYDECLSEAMMLLTIVPDSEMALRCCINMSQTLKRNKQFYEYAQMGYELFPDNPYFIIKYAISLGQQGNTDVALALLRPRTQTPDEYVNPQLIAAYSGVAGDMAAAYLHNHQADSALYVLDLALAYDSTNRELLYNKGVAYELLKQFDLAYEYQNRYYNPTNAEQAEWYEHMRYLRYRGYSNRIDASYTHALYDTRSGSLASTGHLYSIASIAYSYLTQRNTYTAQISYKGIDGYHGEEGDTGGGVGLEFMGQIDHTFNHHWSGMASASYSTRYFNKWGANVALSYAAPRGWTPALRLGYRRTPRTYLYLANTSSELYTNRKYDLFILTPSVEKSWERIKTTLTADVSLLRSDIYYNIGLKGKLFVNEDNISSVSLLCGVGTFPELSFFEQTALQGISHTNAMVGFDAQYLVTKNCALGLAGTWNTCYNPIRLESGALTDSYRNIYSLQMQLHVAF